MELLSFNSLCHVVGVPQRDVGNWIEEFTIYIPRKQQRDGMYYFPEAFDILRFIKKCKDRNYEKREIMKMLTKKRLHNRGVNTVKHDKNRVDQGQHRDNSLTVLQTIGKTVSKVAAQKETIQPIQA